MLTTRYILDEAHLSHYDERLKSWASFQPVKTLPSTLYPWTLTEKAGAVTCWPVGGTELLPTVDFLFSEVPPASGDKGPENPSTISGVESNKVTRCGKNLVPYPFDNTTKKSGGIIWTDNGDGTVTANGTATANSFFWFYGTEAKVLVSGVQYTLSGCPSGGSSTTYYMRFGSGTNHDDAGNGATFTATDADVGRSLCARIGAGTTVSNLTFKPQIELGSTATSFEPYEGTDYTIDLGGTYYGGTVDLATGVMTVTHQAVTPNTETMDISSAPAAIPLDYADTYGRTISSADGTSLSVGSTGGTVVYKLATPQIIQLTPTQILSLAQTDKYTPRLDTVYTDASAMQVGYVKSPIREEFELQQAIVGLGGNV